MTNKSTERKLRYALQKQGTCCISPQTMYRSSQNQFGYMIVDTRINGCVGGFNYDYSLDDVEDFVRDRCIS